MASQPSPRLPSELLGHIIDYLDDSPTMRRCCLAGSGLLPYARRALFTEVRLLVGPTKKSNNLERMLECYTSRPYAQYARHLIVKYRGNRNFASHVLSDYPDLQKLVTLLSTCQQTVDPSVTPAPPAVSNISSLYISGLSGSTRDFARVIRAFPHLTRLQCIIKELWTGSFDLLDLFLASAPPPPRLQHLQCGLSHFNGLDCDVLFPSGVDVCLRSLQINHNVSMELWNTILRRAGDSLEKITVTGYRATLPYRRPSLVLARRVSDLASYC